MTVSTEEIGCPKREDDKDLKLTEPGRRPAQDMILIQECSSSSVEVSFISAAKWGTWDAVPIMTSQSRTKRTQATT